ncbi:MAG TPA: DNA-3-methyladenine glycosylase [Candidatus Polarisedimenticolaceae bacterium]|nr:DNA-3-methyladenine glycosylase [Candidatus Polarisedimenticolaceae bacterium]
MTGRRLGAGFFRRPAVEVARDLLGRTLCRRLPDGTILRGRITEVEAYLGERDLASHARFGLTRRNRIMWEPGGRAYVYFVYGMHHCMNVVTGPGGEAQAVLLRATTSPNGAKATGPARLTKAFAIDRALDGASFLEPESPIWLEEGEPVPDRSVKRTARIGVDYAGTWAKRKLRFLWVPPVGSGPTGRAPRGRRRR